MASFKDDAERELLTVLPDDARRVRAFLSAAAKQGGFLHLVGKRKNLVFVLSSYEECLAVVKLLRVLYPTEFEISAEHVKSGMKKGSTAFSVAVPTGFTGQAVEDLSLAEGGVPEWVGRDRAMAESYLKGSPPSKARRRRERAIISSSRWTEKVMLRSLPRSSRASGCR